MTGKSQAALIHAFALCRAKPNQRVMYCVGTYEGLRFNLERAKYYLEKGEIIKWVNGHIEFPNGSRIIVHKPDSVTGTEVHVVIFDPETGILDHAMIEHLKTRARLR